MKIYSVPDIDRVARHRFDLEALAEVQPAAEREADEWADEEPADEEVVPPFFRPEGSEYASEQTRHWLLKVLGGRVVDLRLLLKLHDRKLSYGELAEALNLNKAEVHRMVRRTENLIRLAGVAEALAAGLLVHAVCAVDTRTARRVRPRFQAAAVRIDTDAVLDELGTDGICRYLVSQSARINRQGTAPSHVVAESLPGGVRLGLGSVLAKPVTAGWRGRRFVVLTAAPAPAHETRRAA